MPTRFASDLVRDTEQIPRWDDSSDVVVVGLGAAGACAAIEARRTGARVLALEGEAEAGGTSAKSSGQLYLGGGTGLQKACGFDDTPEEMARYMIEACGPGADAEKIGLYTQSSVEHYEWLVDIGVPFKPAFVPTTEATNPPGDDGLTYTGSELAHPYREIARPAPRGHNVRHEGDSGFVLMRHLLAEVDRQGAEIRADSRVERLVVDTDARVVGVGVGSEDVERWIQARRGVILCTGGFGFNREMLARYAPPLLDCNPVGTEAEDGLGIRLGAAVGGDLVRMDAGCVIAPFTKPRSLVRGILVNRHGQRFISEDVYQAVHGGAFLYREQGEVYLVLDAKTFSKPLLPFAVVGPCETPSELERVLGIPEGHLLRTLETWNTYARHAQDPLFHKADEWITPLEEPPFWALDLRVASFPYAFFTLGGLRTDVDGRVLTTEGETIEGLYAAGRVGHGLPADGYNSGMSLADCTFFGRRAGRAAALVGRQTGRAAALVGQQTGRAAALSDGSTDRSST